MAGENVSAHDALFSVTPEIADAVMAHMNDDHEADNIVICQHFGGSPDVQSARLAHIDDDGALFAVLRSTGPDTVRVAWSQPLAERAAIRHEFVRMYTEAGG